MTDPSASRTHASLLVRLQQEPNDEAAWCEFAARYGPRIKAWCLRWNLQEADAEEVTQRVLVQLAVKIRRFAYDASGSFRGWLKTLTQHALSDFLHDCRRERVALGGPMSEAGLETAEARHDL